MEYNRPNFKKANMKANEILVASSTINQFPCAVKEIVKEWTDIKCTKFSVAHKHNVNIEAFGSEAAVIQAFEGRYIIFYNQDDQITRVRFSILHELGHYILGHELRTKDIEIYGKEEVEANCFAAQILMPEQIIRELQKRCVKITKTFLIDKFKVSEEAALRRLETLGKYKPEWRHEHEKIFDDTIIYKYSNFLDAIMLKKNKYNWFDDEVEMQKERDSWY